MNQVTGDEPLIPVGSLSWRVFKNPIAAYVGGVTAVLLELAEPRVRTGVWEHTTFRTDPLNRMRRTGEATIVTVYGARKDADKLISRIRKMHESVRGVTPNDQPYHANDPELLDWVHATASYGFLEAYCAFVKPVSEKQKDEFYSDGTDAAFLYGAVGAPCSEAARAAQFQAMLPRLEPSPIIFEFIEILETTRILPSPFRLLQKPLMRASIAILPVEVRTRLELGPEYDLGRSERALIRWLGRRANGLPAPLPRNTRTRHYG